MSRRLTALALLTAACLPTTPARATFTYTDNFSTTSPLWSNLRGDWSTHDGVYDAASPTNAPPTNTSLPWSLGALAIDVDVNAISDGGLWLRSDAGAHNGVLLVTGGGGWGSGNRDAQSGNSLYFHTIHADSYSSPLAKVFPGFSPGDNVHLHITVIGDTYSVYLNNSPTPATTLTTPDFPFGRVGLYDFSPIQSFDNLALSSPNPPGDANQNGSIDPDDYAAIDRGRALHLTSFQDGDFNADHTIDQNDYLLIDTTYLKAHGLPSAGSLLSQRESQFGDTYVSALLASVPEPSVLLLLATDSWLLSTLRPHRRATQFL